MAELVLRALPLLSGHCVYLNDLTAVTCSLINWAPSGDIIKNSNPGLVHDPVGELQPEIHKEILQPCHLQCLEISIL